MTRHGVDGFVMGGGGGGDGVAQFAHQTLDVGRDDGLVLYDQNVGGQFGIDLGLGRADQAFDVMGVGPQDLGRLRWGEAFQRRQQEGLTRARGNPHQPPRGVVAAVHPAGILQAGAGR